MQSRDYAPKLVRKEAKKSLPASPSAPSINVPTVVKEELKLRCPSTSSLPSSKTHRLLEFNLSDSSQEESRNCIISCHRHLADIAAIFEKEFSKFDLDELLNTNLMIQETLKLWLKNTKIVQIEKWKNFQDLLVELKQSLRGTDISKNKDNKHFRGYLVSINQRIDMEFDRLIEDYDEDDSSLSNSQIIEKMDKKEKRIRMALDKIATEEGKAIWKKEFKDSHYINFANFIRILKTHVEDTITSYEERMLLSIIDPYGTHMVTARAFGDFLKAFGPIKHCLENVKSLAKNSWFHPFVTSEEAARLLSDCDPGTFIVRLSRSASGSFALEYVTQERQIRTVLIQTTPQGVCIEIENGNKLVESYLDTLIGSLSDTLTTPFSTEITTQKWFVGNVSDAEMEEKLYLKPPGTFMIYFHPSEIGSFMCSYIKKNGNIAQVEFCKIPQGGYLKRPYNNHKAPESPSLANSTVYKSISDIINTHRDQLKYNYSPDRVPFLLCEFHNTHNVPLFDIKAPQTDKEPTEVGVTGLIEGKSITNYPSDPGMEGFALNCDVMRATHVGNRMVAVVADGCGWGKHARKASEEGSKAVVEYLTKDPATQEKIVDTETCSQELVSSFVYAHEAVVNNQFYPDRRRVGLTTLIAGMTLKLKNQFGTDEEWAFVCASVGDCKAYHWNAKNGKVTDICVGNRNNPHDPKDCGGCIGPFKKDQPDFRNLGTYFQPCRTGDIIMLMSDGVHDNLDPENFGLLPNELEENLNRDWKDWFAAGQKDVEKLKSDFSCKKLEELLAKVKNPTPQDVSALLIKHCLSMTQAKRKLMETTPAGEPVASKEYPGKMDHATILAFVVSDLVVGEEKMKSSAKKEKKRYKPFWKKEFVRNGSSSAGNPFENKINDILPTIPRVFVIPWDMNNSQKFKRSQFSDQECLQNDSGDFFGWAISTFPNMGTKEYPKRIADPITNFFQASLSPGRHCFVLTSGVGYGQEYMTSSSMAASEFNLYMDKAQAKISDTQTAATTLLKALNHAHNKIINIDEHTNETAVTLIGVSAFRLPSLEEEDEQTNTSPSQWAVLCVNVGDHRLFYWNVANQKLTELTKSVSSETDAFHDEVGRIGSIPDLRNLGVYVQFCSDEEDIVIAVSSLVYWNYDPQNLGQPMKEEYKKKWKKWERVPMEVRQEEIMGNIERRLRARSAEVSTGKKLTQLFSEEFKKNTKDVTKPKRQLLKLMENENNKAYNKLYGKMGHATCVVLRVGDFIASKTVPLLPPELKMDLIQRNERKKLLKQSAFQKFVPTAKKPSIDIED